jgi:hypothetical protein
MKKRNLRNEFWVDGKGRAARPDVVPLAPLLPERRGPWHWTLGWMVILVALLVVAGVWRLIFR